MIASFYASKQRLCPVCQNHHGCRIFSDGKVWCLRVTNQADVPESYRLISWLNGGMGASLVPVDSKSQDRKDRQRQQREKTQRKRQRNLSQLPVEDRDKAIRRMHSHIGLSRSDRLLLKQRRGMTDDQIDRGLYFSVHPYQDLPTNIPLNFPGVHWSGRTLTNKYKGIACPLFDSRGLAHGLQIRITDDKTAEEEGRYRWLSGSQLSSGELPLSFIQPQALKQKHPALIEGTGFKPQIAADKLGQIVIGASGGQHAGSPQQLAEYLKAAEKRGLDTSTIQIYLDAGDVANAHVMNRLLKLVDLLHSWNKQVEIAWWGQETKDADDIDELDDVTKIEYISDRKFQPLLEFKAKQQRQIERYCKDFPRKDRVVSRQEWEEKFDKPSFTQWLQNRVGKGIKNLFQRTFFKLNQHQQRPETIRYDPNYPLPTPQEYRGKRAPKIVYKKGQMLDTVRRLKANGWTTIADTSFMGSGKSYNVGLLAPDESNKIWFLDVNHRNVSVDTVKNNYTDLMPRHNGIVEDRDGKLILKKGDSKTSQLPVAIEPNCFQAENFVLLKNKGYNIEGEDNPICSKCPWSGLCHNQKGYGFGFKFERKNTLAMPQIRAHIESLPSPDSYNYDRDIAIVEESGRLLSGTTSISGAWEKDLLLEFDRLETALPEISGQLKPFKNAIRAILTGQVEQGKYGLDHEALISLLPETPANLSETIELIEKSLAIDFDRLIQEPDSVSGCTGKWRELGAATRSHFRGEAKEATSENLKKLPNNLLVNLLKIWNGEPGSLRVNFDAITATIPYKRHSELLKHFGLRILLDATIDISHAAKILDLDPNSIIAIEMERPNLQNLTVYNTHMEGLGSSDRSASALHRIAAYKEASRSSAALKGESIKIVSHLGDEDKDGHWFYHNRGFNDFQGISRMVFVGMPYPDLGAVRDEYRAIYGNLDGFENHYSHLVAAEILQAVGRPRAHLYADRSFVVDFVCSNADIDFLKEYGIEVVRRQAFEVTPQAGTKSQIAKSAIAEFAHQFVRSKQKLTQQGLAQASGLSQGYFAKLVSQFDGGWDGFKKLFLTLYDSLYRIRNNSKKAQDLCQYDVLRAWFDLEPLEVLEEIAELVRVGGWDLLKDVLAPNNTNTQLGILGVVAPIFLPDLPNFDLMGRWGRKFL